MVRTCGLWLRIRVGVARCARGRDPSFQLLQVGRGGRRVRPISGSGGTMRRTRWGLALLSVVVGLAAAGPGVARASNGQIAFSTGFVLPYGDRDVGSQVFVVNPNGTGLKQLTHVAGGHDAADPAWSPDGRRIAFQSNPTGEYDLWVMNRDGSGQHRILRDAGWDDE